MYEDNGILAKVSGSDIARASRHLPPAATAEDRTYEVVLEAAHIGWVKLYARRHKARHNKHSHWFWSVYRAEPTSPPV